jgi:hypothetical protein
MNEDEKHVFHGVVALVLVLAFVSIMDHANSMARAAATPGTAINAEQYLAAPSQPVGP